MDCRLDNPAHAQMLHCSAETVPAGDLHCGRLHEEQFDHLDLVLINDCPGDQNNQWMLGGVLVLAASSTSVRIHEMSVYFLLSELQLY